MTRTLSLLIVLAAAAGCDGNNVDLSGQGGNGGTHADLAVGGGGGGAGDGGAGSGGSGGASGEELPPASGPEVGPYADFVTARAHSYCTWLARCGVVAAADEADCESAETAEVSSAPAPYSVDDGITAGRATLDATATKACTDALDAAGCSARDLDAVRTACLAVVKGSVTTGIGCRADFECSGGWCANVALGCGAVCRPFATAGGDCTAAPCDTASYCSSGHCVADGISAAACDLARPCAAGLVCRGLIPGSPGSTGSCGAIAKAGESCATSDECALGLYCASGTLKCAARVADGAQCTDIDACVTGKSCVGLAYAHGVSVGKPGACGAFLDAGAACDPTADDSGCAVDTACGKTSKTCDAVGAAGSACPTSGCRDGLYCDGNSTCQPLVAYGAGCNAGGLPSQAGCRYGACDSAAHACLTYCP